MFLFVLFTLAFSEEITFGIKFNGQVKLDTNQLVFKLDQSKLDEQIINKCITTDLINFKIVKESEIYGIALYKEIDCSGTSIHKFDLGKIEQTEFTLPPFQQEIQLEGDIKITMASPFGCLLSYLPEMTNQIDSSINKGIVHSQIGASIHTYTSGKCEGDDKIIKIISQAEETINQITTYLKETKLSLPTDKIFGDGEINKFKEITQQLAEKIPNIVDQIFYEFDGIKMKIYKYLEDGTFEFIEEAIQTTADKIIGHIAKCKESGDCDTNELLSITGECVNGLAYGWNGDSLQQLKVGVTGSCDLNEIFTKLFNINQKVMVDMQAQITSEFKENVGLANEQIYKVIDQVNNKVQDVKTAVVESFGSYLEYNLGECVELSLTDMTSTFNDLLGIQFPQQILDYLKTVDELTEEVKQFIERMFGFKIPSYSYKIDALTTGINGKPFVSFGFYETKDCTEKPLFDFVIGVMTDIKVEDIESGFALIKYLTQEDCNDNAQDIFYIEHLNIDKCINGYKYQIENNKVVKTECSASPMKQSSQTTEYECDICVKCQQESGMTAEEYARVKCGTKSIFILLFIMILFIIF